MNYRTRLLSLFFLGGSLFCGSTAFADDSRNKSWHTLPFLRGSLTAGYDSNPLVLSDEIPESDHLYDLSLNIVADVRLRRNVNLRPKTENPPVRAFDMGFGATVNGVAQTGLKSEQPFYQALRAYLDGDLYVCQDKCEDKDGKKPPWKRISLGAIVESSSLELDRVPFHNTFAVEAALMVTWRTYTNCELDNLIVYTRHDDYDDRQSLADPALDRKGRHQSYGFQQTFFQRFVVESDGEGGRTKTGGLDYCKVRRGPFLRFQHDAFWSYRVGYEYQTHDTDGTEFDKRTHRVFLSGEKPFGEERVWAIDGYVEYGDSDFSNTSLFGMGVERRDNYGRVELAVQRHLKPELKNKYLEAMDYMNLRVGVAQTLQDSNVPVYKYDRTYVFITFEVGFKSASEFVGTPESVGSQTVQEGDSGSGRPVVSEKLP